MLAPVGGSSFNSQNIGSAGGGGGGHTPSMEGRGRARARMGLGFRAPGFFGVPYFISETPMLNPQLQIHPENS